MYNTTGQLPLFAREVPRAKAELRFQLDNGTPGKITLEINAPVDVGELTNLLEEISVNLQVYFSNRYKHS